MAAGLDPNRLGNTLSLLLGLNWIGARGVGEQDTSTAIDRAFGPVDLIQAEEGCERSLSSNFLDEVSSVLIQLNRENFMSSLIVSDRGTFHIYRGCHGKTILLNQDLLSCSAYWSAELR